MKITEDIFYAGVSDHRIEQFEAQYRVRNGMSYNSYVIIDEKVAVADTVDVNFGDEWLKNIAEILGERKPDYLIIHHMEPDHSANIKRFMDTYPEAVIISNAKSFVMMKQFFGLDFQGRQKPVAEGEKFSLGKHELTAYMAPMVHWPEVMVTFDSYSGTLFSADAFGKFGAVDVDEPWDEEAGRYYFGIVGKYGTQVQMLLKKAAQLKIERICPLHGPVLTDTCGHCVELYRTWSAYEPEIDGVVVAYASVYGHTKEAALLAAEKLREKGCRTVVYDLTTDDMSAAVADAFRYSRLVLASVTYNAGVFPAMRDFIEHLTERNFSRRKAAFIENGTWAPAAAKTMMKMLENSKGIELAKTSVCIRSSMTAEVRDAVCALAEEMAGQTVE